MFSGGIERDQQNEMGKGELFNPTSYQPFGACCILKLLDLFKYMWPFSGHQTPKG